MITARRIAMAAFMVSLVLAPSLGTPMLWIAGASMIAVAAIWFFRRFEREDPYDLAVLREIHDQAEWLACAHELHPEADRVICPHCGEENDASRPMCRRCGALQL